MEPARIILPPGVEDPGAAAAGEGRGSDAGALARVLGAVRRGLVWLMRRVMPRVLSTLSAFVVTYLLAATHASR